MPQVSEASTSLLPLELAKLSLVPKLIWVEFLSLVSEENQTSTVSSVKKTFYKENLPSQTGTFPVQVLSDLHTLCSVPPAKKKPGWQV